MEVRLSLYGSWIEQATLIREQGYTYIYVEKNIYTHVHKISYRLLALDIILQKMR